MSIVEQYILDRTFPYLQPYFYNHPYALRCELGVGDEEYMTNARTRALEICVILFPKGADAFIFNYWIYDYSDSGDAHRQGIEELGLDPAELIENTIYFENKRLRFLMENQNKYRHIVLKDLEIYDDSNAENDRRNRVVCYSDPEAEIDHVTLLDMQINEDGHEIGLVSFENECILSVYDDRGCDVVFFILEKMKEFYDRLKPYFLEFDAEEMEKRFHTPAT